MMPNCPCDFCMDKMMMGIKPTSCVCKVCKEYDKGVQKTMEAFAR